MPKITILADITTGKLIQKYLNRDIGSVVCHQPDTENAKEPVSLYIIDVAGMREDIGTAISRLNDSTGCSQYILITSMENPVLNGELGPLRERYAVSLIAKPIKLSELKRLVAEVMDERPHFSETQQM